MSEVSPAKCRRCGAVLTGATGGLCPRCLMAEAMQPTRAGDEATALPPLTPEEIAPHFPQLDILECLGRGGMGVVYKARQKSLNRLVALKLLAPERADDPQFAARFEKEAQALAALNHPHIVAVYDSGRAGGFYYLLMEFVDGVNLRQLLRTRRLSPREALAIVPPICDALQCAHDHGIVHRDIKPENLLVHRQGAVKIADFGIAKILGDGTHETQVTQASAAGTPDYAAPEQRAENADVDHRADIYSLGVVLYEMLTGERPAEKIVVPSRRVQVDVRIDEVVLRALEKEPELRFATAAEFRSQVETVVAGTPASRSAVSLIKAGTSTLTTPAEIATWQGQFFCYRTRGQLLLDDRQITHTCSRGVTVIPLAAIRDVSIGRFPRSMNPIGLSVISVSYEAGGVRRQVLLGPMEGYFGSPHSWDARIAEWHGAIKEAVTAATGREPASTPADQLGIPRESLVPLLAFAGIPVLVGTLILLALNPGRTEIALGPFIALILTFAVVVLLLVAVPAKFLRRVTSGGAVLAGAITLLLLLLALLWFLLPGPGAMPPPAAVVSEAPPSPEQMSQRAWQLWQSGQAAEALPIFREAVRHTPDDAQTWNGLGWSAFNSGETEEAMAAFRKALALDPQHVAALNGLGQIHLSRREYPEAEAAFLKAAPQGASAAWYGLARLYLLQGKFSEAEKYAQMLEDSGQADAVAKKMLEAAKSQHLSEGLRVTIEPPEPAPLSPKPKP